MDKASNRAKRPHRSFTPEFKAEAVRLCQVGDRTISRVASDLNIGENALREGTNCGHTNCGQALFQLGHKLWTGTVRALI